MTLTDKLVALYSIMRLFTNWHEAVLAVFGLLKTPTFTAKCRNGLVVSGNNRGGKSDFVTIHEIFFCKSYSRLPYITETTKTIIDAGANVGCFSLFCKTVSPNTKVYSIEPGHE
ncbi:hypothetical protein BVX97_00655, partial [bacterium E08(2017)]